MWGLDVGGDFLFFLTGVDFGFAGGALQYPVAVGAPGGLQYGTDAEAVAVGADPMRGHFPVVEGFEGVDHGHGAGDGGEVVALFLFVPAFVAGLFVLEFLEGFLVFLLLEFGVHGAV